ncbi:MAG: hypothetical protein NTX53_16225 [candidate division WOR-3 bacterium]|nr:hypothetical protein [candidate division WOR-3 bacterium]
MDRLLVQLFDQLLVEFSDPLLLKLFDPLLVRLSDRLLVKLFVRFLVQLLDKLFDQLLVKLSDRFTDQVDERRTGLDFRPVSRQIQTMFVDWLLLALTYLWAVFLVSLGVYALTMKGHSSRRVAIIIKILGVPVLPWGLRELLVTTASRAGAVQSLTPAAATL